MKHSRARARNPRKPSFAPRPNRYAQARYAQAVVLAVLAALVATLVLPFIGSNDEPEQERPLPPPTGVLGDVDNDGTVSNTEEKQLADTAESAKVTVDQVLPKVKSGSYLLTPPGADWWSLVSSMAPDLDLGADNPPEGAAWYLSSTVEARNSYSYQQAYPMVAAQFEDTSSASEYATSLGASGRPVQVLERGDGLLVITPSWVDPSTEPFRAVEDTVKRSDPAYKSPLTKLDDISPEVGLWQLNIGEFIDQGASSSSNPGQYRKFWRALGFGGKTGYWQATSAAPDRPWRGAIRGFEKKKVSVDDAVRALNRARKCTNPRPNSCGDVSAMPDSLNYMYLSQAGAPGAGLVDWDGPKPYGDVPDIYVGMAPYALSAMLGHRQLYYPPMQRWSWSVQGDEMTVLPEFQIAR